MTMTDETGFAYIEKQGVIIRDLTEELLECRRDNDDQDRLLNQNYQSYHTELSRLRGELDEARRERDDRITQNLTLMNQLKVAGSMIAAYDAADRLREQGG